MEHGNAYEGLVAELVARRREHCFPLGIRRTVRQITDRTLALLFPHFSDTHRCDSSAIADEIHALEGALQKLLDDLHESGLPHPGPVIPKFLELLPEIYSHLALDARAIHEGDPASVSVDEVILSYPGFFAIAVHRVAHALHQLGYPLLPRLLGEHAHQATGVDIHPGATIGRSFFIDHGTGVVIGETAIIGNGVRVYQGVTLGALLVEKRLANRKRHPTIGDNVVIYANATILGGSTVVGHDTVVGGNAWITESVPPFSVVGRHSDVRPRRPGDDADIEFHI